MQSVSILDEELICPQCGESKTPKATTCQKCFGLSQRIDLAGQQFGKWTVVERGMRTPSGNTRWICQCACGTLREVDSSSLRSGESKSCGCAMPHGYGHNHGLSKSPEYAPWAGARDRCRNPNSKDWHNYGGRGITFDESWDDFLVFLADVGPRPSLKHSLNRIDNDGPYAPGNVEWATAQEQVANQRPQVHVKDLVDAGLVTWEQIAEVRAMRQQQQDAQ